MILGNSIKEVLRGAEEAVKKINNLSNVILPFPGGVVRSGSKVGSKYKKLLASTNFEYCPTLKGLVESKINSDVKSVLEIVIDGITEKDISRAMKEGINAILHLGDKTGIKIISAGNYGGKLGPYHFHLREIIK